MKGSVRIIFCAVIAYLFVAGPAALAQQFSYTNESLLSVISDIESHTAYRFLYREALIKGIHLSFSADEPELMAILSDELAPTLVGLKVDEERKQALLYQSSERIQSQEVRISGYVLDAETGERLPYSTISWREDGSLKGISSEPNGSFSTSIRTSDEQLTLLISFVGYHPKRVVLDLKERSSYSGLGIRLEPEPYSGKEILIQGVNFYTASDTVMEGLVKMGSFSPLGESNAVRSLQMLPAVSMTNAINNGINIRGSSSDGFQVLLDGQTVYHQSHLFGLLDAMNANVLKTSGFYYDITPAQFQAPLGGTLSLLTRTGSLNEIRGSAGLSNTAVKASLEGPLFKGNSSWLVSGRLSYLDQINWMNNQGLVEYGLDVDRPRDLNYIFEQNIPNFFLRGVRAIGTEVEDTEAQFYDLHSKLYFETRNGSRLSLSGYLGHDDASQSYLRRDFDAVNTFQTKNLWDTKNVTGSFTTSFSPNWISQTTSGFSAYNSVYDKQDFRYQLRTNPDQPRARIDTSIVAPLRLENDLQDFSFAQTISTSGDRNNMEFGVNYTDFDVQYTERSLRQTSFFSRRTSQLVDVFHQLDMNTGASVSLSLGNRLHYFSNGQYLRWSPRIKADFLPEQAFSFNLGFSRNYQFIHRLAFYNINSSDFWILSNEDQPPSEVNYYSAGLKFRYFSHTYFQIESYYKDFNYLRFHELNTGLVSNSFKGNEVPWFYNNDGIGKGIEFMVKNQIDVLTLTTAYTLSSIQIKNEQINDGEYFYPDWDRRHQISMVSELEIATGLDLLFSWTYGSGNPNRLDLERLNEPSRLPYYSRFDVSVTYSAPVRHGTLKGSFSVYNIFNRNNPWYNEVEPVVVALRNREIRGSSISNVYDLGVQPSFNIGFYF
jgi:hypothetical protein